MKPNLVLNLPGGFYQDARLDRYFREFERRYPFGKPIIRRRIRFARIFCGLTRFSHGRPPEFARQDLRPASGPRRIDQ